MDDENKSSAAKENEADDMEEVGSPFWVGRTTTGANTGTAFLFLVASAGGVGGCLLGVRFFFGDTNNSSAAKENEADDSEDGELPFGSTTTGTAARTVLRAA